uniref:non-specific serine/threonine protein kinase n=1 Tax=Fagus sylvatica TaxID=28930 RepID=A0A2N9IHR5_FAGSY
MGVLSSMFVIPNLLFFFFETTYGIDSITSTQSLADGNTLVSKDGNFELGFFSPGSSKNRYLGIWYKNIQDKTVVWVANRDSPINDSSGILMINSTASLVILSQNKSVVWSTSSLKQAQTPLLQLLDTGNLVLTDEKSEAYLFQGTSKNTIRTGPWNGFGFSGSPGLKPNPVYAFTFVYNQDEVYFMFTLKDKSLLSRAVPNQTTSMFQAFHTEGNSTKLEVYSALPIDRCDSYGVCGAYGRYYIHMGEHKYESQGMQGKCLSNCSCTAYTNSDIKEGIGCAIWFGDLLDIKQFPDGGQDLYIRMHPSELEKLENNVMIDQNIEGQREDQELPLFNLTTIVAATNNFSSNNKLGEGGFGPVYKGTLTDGQEIAVKRLSRGSGQGLSEFKNEVMLIAKLQHRNLVRLLGCCIEGEENMLIYEYMPNEA